MTIFWTPWVIGGLAVLAFSASTETDDWPRFRGPNGSGVSASTGLPMTFSPGRSAAAPTALNWRTRVPFGRSSPVIAGQRVFLTASEGDRLIVLCLDRASGRERWRREIARTHVTPTYRFNDPASPTPVSDGRNVYVFFADLGLISFDADGRERWRRPLGPFNTFYGLAASPILAGDALLMICDTRTGAFLLAVDAATGTTRWQVDRSRDVALEGHASPVVWTPSGGTAQAIVLGSGRIDAYDVATGRRTWWLRGLASLPISSPILGADVVIASTYGADKPPGPPWEAWLKADTDGDGRLSAAEAKYEEFGAIDRNNDGFVDREEWEALRSAALGRYGTVAVRLGGRGDLTQDGMIWRNPRIHAFVPSAIVYKDVLYAVDSGGIISALDPRTGEIIQVGRSSEAPGEYYASPVAADDKVFFTSEAGKVTVIKAGRAWEIIAVNDLGEECYATPAIAGGRIFFRTREALYAFGR